MVGLPPSAPATGDAARSAAAPSALRRILFMGALIIAGEAIFGLPFHIARFFRPTMLEVFGLTNTELGAVQAVYGVTAMLAYFPGGPIADLFSARRLLTASLLLTAMGGLYLATIPSTVALWWIFGFWGVTTILLFWAALIRATREWGGHREQGEAYGILDGGRGLLAAVLAAVGVAMFGWFLPEDPTIATDQERLRAMQGIILSYTAATGASAVLVWLFVPEGEADRRPHWFPVGKHIATVLRMPAVWLQALIVVCAYVAFKGVDQYSLFAVEAYGMNEVEGARVTAIAAWTRPFAAIGAGLIGDRIRSSRVITAGFAILIASNLYFALSHPAPGVQWPLLANVLVACIAIFALRGVYFALFEEAAVPATVTGTAVGLVSVIGYTPDVFVALVAGILMDGSPGVTGHQHFYFFLTAFAGIGLGASLAFQLVTERARPGAAGPR